jgi:hypothetical protein
MVRKRAILMSLALALLTGRCRYSVENGAYDLSRFREDKTLVTLPEEMRGLVPTNREAARAIETGPGGRDLRFVIIGDTVSGHNGTFKGFLREIAALDPPPAFIVHLGDRAVSPVAKSFGAYLKVIEDPPCPIIHVDGNHDVREEGERLSRAFFGDRDFYFDLGDKRFVFMGDSRPHGTHGFSREQMDWLEGALGPSAPARKFFFAHVPPRAPFKRIDPGLASLFTPAIENEKEFLDILARHHVVMAAFGHRHVHASLVYNGVLMVITGGGGQQNFLDPNVEEPLFTKRNHYTLVDIPRTGPGEPLQGVLSCVGERHENLFISSFSQPSLMAGGPALAVALRPYPTSDFGLIRPGDPAAANLAVSSRTP